MYCNTDIMVNQVYSKREPGVIQIVLVIVTLIYRSSAVDVVLVCDAVLCHIVVSIAGDVDEFEISLHASRHACRVACQFLSDAFLKRSPFPTTHFLNLGV
jgi:hypothetical protein